MNIIYVSFQSMKCSEAYFTFWVRTGKGTLRWVRYHFQIGAILAVKKIEIQKFQNLKFTNGLMPIDG